MNEHTFYQQDNFTVTDDAHLLNETGDQLIQEKCASEGFNSNYFSDNFLGIYFKAFELFRIFFR